MNRSSQIFNYCLLLLFFFPCFSSSFAQWSPLNNTQTDDYRELSFPSDQVGFIASRNGEFVTAPLFKTTNGGSTWDTIPYPIPAGYTTELEAVEFVDTQNGYLIGQVYDSSMVFPIAESFMHKTTDGGASWTDVTPSLTLNSPHTSFITADHGLVCGVEELYQTTDGGNTWNSTSLASFGPFHVQLVSATTGYIGGFALVNQTSQVGWISKTTDGGATWTQLNYPGGYILFRSAHFVDENNGYVVGENPVTNLLHTTDGGQSWVTKALPVSFGVALRFSDDSTGYVAQGQGIFKTTDYGNNWVIDLNDQQARNINDIKFAGNVGYTCGSNGLLYKTDPATSIDDGNLENGPRAYPNPVAADGRLILDLPAGFSGTVQLSDLSGRILMSREMDANGENRLDLSRLQLAPGTYLLGFTISDGRVRAQKVILTR